MKFAKPHKHKLPGRKRWNDLPLGWTPLRNENIAKHSLYWDFAHRRISLILWWKPTISDIPF